MSELMTAEADARQPTMVSVSQKVLRACLCGHAFDAHNSEGCEGWHAVHSDGVEDEVWLPVASGGGTLKVRREDCNCPHYQGEVVDLGIVNYHHKRLVCRLLYRLERWARGQREAFERRG